MFFYIFRLLTVIALAGFSFPTVAQSLNVKPSLAFETRSPEAGSTIRVAILFKPGNGWHTYWINPGEVGAAPRVRWMMPAGIVFSDFSYPTPSLLNVQGIVSYVHKGEHAFLLEMSVPKGLAKGTPIPISADLEWLSCSSTQCVPERTVLKQLLVVGDGSTDFSGLSIIRQAEALAPSSIDGAAFDKVGNELLFSIPGKHPGAVLFPSDKDWFSADAKQNVEILGDMTIIRIVSDAEKLGKRFSGVISSQLGSFEISGAQRDESLISSLRSKSVVSPVEEGASPSGGDSHSLPLESPDALSGGNQDETTKKPDISVDMQAETHPTRLGIDWKAITGALVAGLIAAFAALRIFRRP